MQKIDPTRLLHNGFTPEEIDDLIDAEEKTDADLRVSMSKRTRDRGDNVSRRGRQSDAVRGMQRSERKRRRNEKSADDF